MISKEQAERLIKSVLPQMENELCGIRRAIAVAETNEEYFRLVSEACRLEGIIEHMKRGNDDDRKTPDIRGNR